MTFDGKVLGEEVVAAAKGYVDKQIIPLLARLDAINARLAQPVEMPDLAPIEQDIAAIFLAFSEMPDVEELIAKAIAGNLVGIMSNGTTKAIGQVNGKDGAPGLPGRDGADGFGFDDLDVVDRDDGIFLRFQKGEAVKEFRLPIPRDRGFFKDGTYLKGDGVTFGGSYWLAQVDSPDGRPEIGNKDWRLAVKRARDGKDAMNGKRIS